MEELVTKASHHQEATHSTHRSWPEGGIGQGLNWATAWSYRGSRYADMVIDGSSFSSRKQN